MNAKAKPGDRRRGNGKNLLNAAKEAMKAAEPAIVHESEWIDREKIAPKLRRIMDLPCWPDVELQLMAGMPIWDLARYIHETRKEASWLSRRSLVEYLGLLKASVPIPQRVAAFGAIRGEHLQKRWGGRAAMVETLWNQIEELNVMLEAAHAQRQLDGIYNPEILTMMGRLGQLVAQAHQIQKDLGMVGDKPMEVRGISVELVQKVRMVAGDAAAEALMDPAAQGRVLEALRRAAQAAGLPGSGLDETMDYQYEEDAEPGGEEAPEADGSSRQQEKD